MVVAHNLLAANANRQFGIVSNNKKKSTEKLSSGFRINRASDDAAGLTISEKLRWQVRGLNKASDNCNAGVDFCKVSDGAMNEVSMMLNRMKELTVQAANDTNTEADREAIQAELSQLSTEIDRIDSTTEFNTLKVFSWERNKIVSAGDNVNGWDEIHRETITVEGIHYGITDVLGEQNVYGADSTQKVKLDSPIDFSTGGWTTTGKPKYTINNNPNDFDQIYKTWGIHPNIHGVGSADSAALYAFVTGSASTADQFFDYKDQGIRVTLKHNSDIKSSPTDYAVTTVLVERGNYTTASNGQTIFRKTSKLGTYNFTDRSNGVYHSGTMADPFAGDCGSAWLDFSGLDRGDFKLEDLYGQGFNTKCATCNRPYSIRFTGDTCQNYTSDGSNVNYTYESGKASCLTINISDCTSGADIVKHVLSATSAVSYFTNHYQQYAYHSSNPNKLYIYDNRSAWSNGGDSQFVPTAVDTSGKQIIKDTIIHHAASGTKTVFSDKNLWIQSGSTDKSGFFIQKARCNSTYLGVSCLNVMNFDSASASIDAVDGAIEILNDQRSMMGAQQNRLELAARVDDNTAEQSDAAESRIRDTDMAKEMISYSKHNILAQVGQAMMSQANQSTQGVLSLIQ